MQIKSSTHTTEAYAFSPTDERVKCTMVGESANQENKNDEHSLPRPSLALKHRHEANKILLSLDETKLLNNIAYRGNHLHELKSCARDLNNGIRDHYATFIHNVGRNIYPLIIATDYEADGLCGIGTTLTLYEANGRITKISPARDSNYELYKTCAHSFMGLSVELGPYLANAGLCCKNTCDGSDHVVRGAPCSCLPLPNHDVSWKKSLSEFHCRIRIFRNALMQASEIEESLACDGTEEDDDDNATKAFTSNELPPLEMRSIMLAMLSSVADFCETCLTTGMLDISTWEQLNRENFPRIKACMKEATKAQADACVEQIVKWRNMLGKDAWSDLYVVIPTVWAVDGENPRKEMFRRLMDADKVDTHIITSEYPRDHNDARTLLGRVVGDRAIGRFVFGLESLEHQIKVMGLSSEVDVVQDDAIPAIWAACEKQGCPIRKR